MDDTGIFEWTFRGAVTGLFILGGKLWGNLVDDVKELKKQSGSHENNLSQFKLHVSEHYPKEVTMARLYETIEKISDDMTEMKIMLAKRNH